MRIIWVQIRGRISGTLMAGSALIQRMIIMVRKDRLDSLMRLSRASVTQLPINFLTFLRDHTMSAPYWNRDNLISHYQKHPAGEDKECWCDLKQEFPGPISQDGYEQSSLDVINRPWLIFQAGRKDTNHDNCEQVKYFVDDRLCLTAVNIKSSRIKTCFHVHINQGHHKILSGDFAKLAFLNKWKHKVSNPQILIKNCSQSSIKLMRTYIQEFKATKRGVGC